MELSNDLLSKFAKVVKDDKKPNAETTVYGTAVEYNGKMYARLDGSDRLTPITTTTAVKAGDRVTVLIKNHSALITGNISAPSANKDDIKDVNNKVDQMGNQITQFEILVADKVSTQELNAQIGRIDELVSENVIVKGQLTAAEANIEKLQAEDVTITGKLTAVDADIKKLNVDKLDATAADIKFATIESLKATDANIHNLKADYGDFKVLATDKLTAADADIKRLDAETIKAKDADLKYATIDFANIGEAAVKKLFADSGIIKDLIVSGGHITGELVGVTIKGDLIEGGTVKADKLVVKGTDGLYYKLNVTGEQVEALQTNENSLNGSIITAKSITATKIAVDDLVAFNATIGGFNLTNSAIYSGVKSSATNTTRGIYLDREGQLAVGDGRNFLRYYKDQNGKYKLELSASSISLGTTNKDLETTLGETISSNVEEFYQSTSPIELIGGSWSRVQPTWVDGKYIWRRNIVTYANGTINYSPSEQGICISGNTGAAGEKGEDAITLHILSSNGNLFKNSSLSTTLTVTIITGSQMITSAAEMRAKFGPQANIEWEQKRFGEATFTKIDPTDPRISDDGFILTLTTTDVYTHTVFNCGLNY